MDNTESTDKPQNIHSFWFFCLHYKEEHSFSTPHLPCYSYKAKKTGGRSTPPPSPNYHWPLLPLFGSCSCKILSLQCALCICNHRCAAANVPFTGTSYLVSWCFMPSQPQRITSGLNTIFTLSPSYSFHESSYHKSRFLRLFLFRGHSTWEPASGRVTDFILWAYTGTIC